MQSTTYYQKEILKDTKQYLGIIDTTYSIVIGGDYNQDIVSREVANFHTELGVKDVHSSFNMIELKNLDHICIVRSKWIDSITMSYDLIEFIEGSKLHKTNDITNTDYRSYVIDLNIEQCIEVEIRS